MTARKIKKSWWCDFQVCHIRYRYRSPENSKMGAQAYEALLRRELAMHGTVQSIKAETKELVEMPTLTEFVPRWLSGYVMTNNRPKEIQQKQSVLSNHILPILGNQRLDAINAEQIEQYKAAKITDGLHPKTVNNHLIIIHRCLTTAKEWSLLKDVPRVKMLKMADPPFKYLSHDEVGRLLAVIPQGLWYAMTLIAVRTGLRYSELSALKWEDIDLVRGEITVRRTIVEGHEGSTKNNRIRHIPMTREVKEKLIKMGKGTEYIFSLNGKPVWYKTARLWLQKYCKFANVQIVGWHVLRHTFASHLVASGAPLVAVQKLMGHADIKMTLRYAHLGQEELRTTINLLEPQKEIEMATCPATA